MSGPFVRWSQTVRKSGTVEILSHHETEVPAMGESQEAPIGRPATRLIVRPLGDSPFYDTIDVTSTQARAMLEGYLRTGAHVGKSLSWVSRGTGKYRRDSIMLKPVRF